jgi:hypothetical protein
MPDPSISEDDALRVTRSYLDRMYRQPPPRDIEGEVMRSILAPRSRRSIPVVRLAASGLMVVAIAAVACVALLVHSGRSSTAGASAGWSIVSNSTTAAENSGLTAVTCVSADDCWAAGYSWEPSGNTQPLIEQDLGTGWTVVFGPNPNLSSNSDTQLQAVTCVSAGACWAVGFPSGPNGQVVMHENGQPAG